MRLEGTLDAFSLPDIFQLLSFTKKTGTLHLRKESAHGAVHLRDGAVTGARADVARQELVRRLLGSGLVDDDALAAAAEELSGDASLSLAQLLAEKAGLDVEQVKEIAAEQVNDAVFSMLRWTEGEFAFVVDETDPDDLGATVPVEEVVAEGQRRLEAWATLVEEVPAPDAVVTVNAAPSDEPSATRDEWALLALVDGRRTVADLVALAGRGEYAVVSALAGLVGRGLLVVGGSGDDQLVKRQSLLAALEGTPAPVAPPAPKAATSHAAPAIPAPAAPVIPERPEPFTPARRPEHAEESPAYARSGSPVPTASAGSHGSVHGATALQPDADPAIASLIERDPSVNKSLLLRLIAGVRGL
ncbi:DUF4388 domain-containing protein [uncultured Arthrobacter sp.]|uniref:DUF4388 domain-containing protein n=1 Tax=uncultured Arthrobacter sp. TaxID=114050 RepID=UPI003217B0E9